MRLFRRKERFDPVAADEQVLDALRDLGADLRKPRDARFYLYVCSREDADAAAEEVRAVGYAADVDESATPDGPTPWLVLASRDMVTDATTIADARRLFDGLAERYAGDYDGWEAAAD